MLFPDAHIHVADIEGWTPVRNSCVCSCAHSVQEFFLSARAKQKHPENIVCAYGIHPQNPDMKELSFLEGLLKEDKICAVGEMGFDLFTKEYALKLKAQNDVWISQLELALEFNKPIVVHCRKALDKLFPFCTKLSKLPAVVFHSFSGSFVEAQSFLKRRVNAYFSFGKQLLNGNKIAAMCAGNLPLERILLETDAPFQTLKGQFATPPEDIIFVYKAFAQLRKESLEHVCKNIAQNFDLVFKGHFLPK